MKQRRRIYYSAAQRSEIWDRWQAGEPMSSIGRRFDRESSSVFSVISPTSACVVPAGTMNDTSSTAVSVFPSTVKVFVMALTSIFGASPASGLRQRRPGSRSSA
jgi:hypothetical protein